MSVNNINNIGFHVFDPVLNFELSTYIDKNKTKQLLEYALKQGLTEEQFNTAYDAWPKSKHTWRQISGLKYIIENKLTIE